MFPKIRVFRTVTPGYADRTTKPKFLADADLSEYVIDGVRRRNPDCDFLTAGEGGVRGLDDTSILRLAAAVDRILVSSDCNTMTAHFYRFIAETESPGLIIVPQELQLAIAIDQLVLIAEAGDADEYRNLVTWIRFIPVD
ncbi:MAG TPA: DUF5615 family PIN-like protein [Bryobacteraceae bacterium]|nr:DUF5615 family PIN-like protein [Bryobacteraceae bacterium]